MRKPRPFIIQRLIPPPPSKEMLETIKWEDVDCAVQPDTQSALKAIKSFATDKPQAFRVIQVCRDVCVRKEMRPVTVVEE